MTIKKPVVNPEEMPQAEVVEKPQDQNLEQPETKPESPVEVEESPESQFEQEGTVTSEKHEAASSDGQQSGAASAQSTAPVKEKSQDLLEIESILSDGLEELYGNLPENRKKEFKEKGEEAAGKIEILLNAAKVKVGKIVDIIKNWLSMIPGVNKFFLEQESKIKADKLLEYKEDKESK